MTQMVFDGLDADDEGTISMDEYTDASTSNEVLRVGDVCKFFDEERRKGVLEKFFDDTNLKAKNKQNMNKKNNKLNKKKADDSPTVLEKVIDAIDKAIDI